MRGSVIKRGESWSYVIDLGRDEEGKRRQRWKLGDASSSGLGSRRGQPGDRGSSAQGREEGTRCPDGRPVVALLETARGSKWEIPLVLATTTGARRSEVLAARWSDLELDRARLRVTRSLQRVAAGDGVSTSLQFMEPKTDRARREVALTAPTVERLRRHRQEQTTRRLAIGPGWTDLDLVCDRGDGAPLDPDAFTRGFKRLAARAGLDPRTRLHDCRHGVATTMLAKGVHPAIASAVLGHASPAFTMSVYQHVLDGMTAQAADALEAAFAEAATPPTAGAR